MFHVEIKTAENYRQKASNMAVRRGEFRNGVDHPERRKEDGESKKRIYVQS